jgi:hypothetical protein
MAYVKNFSSWGDSDKILNTHMDNFETQYSESSIYLNNHNHLSIYYTKNEMLATFWCADNDGHESGADADLIYHADGNLHAEDFDGLGAPAGLIVMWAGETVPDGWHLCDGTGGTIDLRDRFVVCAGTGSDYNVGDTGTGTHTIAGGVTISGHALTVAEIAGHQHALKDRCSLAGGSGYSQEGSGKQYAGAYYNGDTTGNSNIGKVTADAHTHEANFSSGNFTITPMYYSLKFIQKL